MTQSKLTHQTRISSQSSSRQGAVIDTFLVHHQAGTNDDAVIDQMVSGAREVSANYTISSEGRITCVVPEELRAWTSGSSTDGGRGAAWDRRSITVEIENESAGGAWPISEAAIRAAAALLQDLRARYPIAQVLGHRQLKELYNASYSTFCPGPETVGRIVALAGGAPLPAPVGGGSGSYPTGTYNGYDIRTIQRIVGAEVDGVYGPETWAKVRNYQAAHPGLVIDGEVGPLTWAVMQGGAPAPTDVKLVVDGDWGPRTTRALQRALGVDDDGVIGPITRKALQRKLGVEQDGDWGPITRKALQRKLGVEQDGDWGPITVRALQTALNTGTF